MRPLRLIAALTLVATTLVMLVATTTAETKSIAANGYTLYGDTSPVERGCYSSPSSSCEGLYHYSLSWKVDGPTPIYHMETSSTGFNASPPFSWHKTGSGYSDCWNCVTTPQASAFKCGTQSNCSYPNGVAARHRFQHSNIGVRITYTSSTGHHSSHCWWNDPSNSC